VIHLVRPTDIPAYFNSDRVLQFRAESEAFFRRPERTRRQERYDFPLFPERMFRDVMNDIIAYSHGKCAYCESPITFPGNASLDRFRPKAGALGLDGDYSTEHYWWLAYEWLNILPNCLKCNKFKGAKFPVDGRRVPSEAPITELAKEKRLIIDPAADKPEEHLDFGDDGLVRPKSSAGDVTIATLELNRSDLVSHRRRVAGETLQQLRDVKPTAVIIEQAISWLGRLAIGEGIQKHPTSLGRLAGALNADRPYVAVARAVVKRWAEAARSTPAAKGQAMAAQEVVQTITPPPVQRASLTKTGTLPIPTRGPRAHKAYAETATARRTNRQAQALRSFAVTRIAIRNFKGIKELDISIDFGRGQGAPWTVLLGENATGKSSILQAIALTLIESDEDGSSSIKPTTVLRKGTSSGCVKVWLDESSEPRMLEFGKRLRRFKRSGPTFPSVLLGYGATRLLPRKRMPHRRRAIRLENMFDPFRPLIDANWWLGQLDKKSFDFVARSLKDVLGLPRSSRLMRVRRQGAPGVQLKLFGADLGLQELSDGYQSVLGLTCDIIAGLHASSRGALEAAEGVVVIDELGSHLHPRWRMRVVESLRRAFRRVQFIVSTHDPLCLRGLENGEAVVLRRTNRGRIYPVPDLPPVKGLRVEQLLMSEYFGLDSTMDPEIEAKIRERYRLLALRSPTEKQKQRMAELREELAPFELPGATRRERRLLEIIDTELARSDQEPSRDKRRELRQETDLLVADLNNVLSKAVTA
jgi:hypothetical protein